MKKHYLSIALLSVVFLITTAARNLPVKTDFAGKWILDHKEYPEMEKLPKEFYFEIIVSDKNNNALLIETQYKSKSTDARIMPNRSSKIAIYKDLENIGNGQVLKVVQTQEKNSLGTVVTYKANELWTLSKDKKVLIIQRTANGQGKKIEIDKSVYYRE